MDFDDMLDEGVELRRHRHAQPRVLQRQFDLDNNDDLDRMRNCPFSLTDSKSEPNRPYMFSAAHKVMA